MCIRDSPTANLQVIVVDAKDHMAGRLASVVAKQLLMGQKVVIVRAEGACLSGGIVRQRMKYMRYKDLRHITQPAKGPFHFRAPTKMLYKSIRGMIPHKTKRGMEALGRLKLFEGVPPPYDKVKLLVIPDALRVLRLQTGHRFCSLGDLAHSVGWKFQGVVEELEAERKQAAQAYYTEKKAARAALAKAKAKVGA